MGEDVVRLPFLFHEYAQRTIRGASTPFEQAVLIENAVRTDRRVNPVEVGSSYARLETFLFADPGQPGAQVGGSEQSRPPSRCWPARWDCRPG